MTFSDMIQSMFYSSQGGAAVQPAPAPAKKYGAGSGDAVFGEILGSRMDRTDERQYSLKKTGVRTAEAGGADAARPDKSDGKTKFLTFREANSRNVKAAVSDTKNVKNAKPAGGIDETDEKAEKSSAAERRQYNMLCAFSQLLGIGIGDLQKILKEAGISAEAFGSMEDAGGISSRLSQILELDKSQEDILAEMLQLTADMAEAYLPENGLSPAEEGLPGDAGQQDGITGADPAAADPLSAAIKEDQAVNMIASDPGAPASDLEARIKLRLKELGIRLEKDRGAVGSELEDLMRSMSAKAREQAQATLSEEDANQRAPVHEKNTKEPDSRDENGYAATDTEATAGQPVVIAGETQPQAAFAVIPADQTRGGGVLSSAAEKIPVDAKEMLSQVIEKAKVVLTPDKSEMVMDLKPESLGKISLKVVTENGIVTARFVAENQQVRQVLESNMQLLKDSLERQGMNIQGFSVSVRQDSKQSADSRPQLGKSGGGSISRAEYGAAFMEGGPAEFTEASWAADPYGWSGSSINLTA